MTSEGSPEVLDRQALLPVPVDVILELLGVTRSPTKERQMRQVVPSQKIQNRTKSPDDRLVTVPTVGPVTRPVTSCQEATK